MEHHTCGSPVVQLLGECSSSGSSLLPRPRLSDTPRRRQEHPTAETAHASRLTTSLSNTPARNHVLSPTPLDLHPVVTPRIDSRGEARASASPSATPTTAAATVAVGDGAAAAAAMPTRDTLYATTWWLNHPSDYDAISAPPRRRGKRLNPLRLKEPQMIPYEVAWPSNDSRVAAPRHANAVPQRQAQAAPPQRQSDPVAAQRLQQQQQQQQRQRELDQQRQQEQRQRELQQQQIQQQQQQRQRETAQQERQRPLSPRAPPAKATPQLESELAPRRLSEAQPNRDAVASSKSQHLPAPPPRHSASTDSSRGAQAPPPGRVLVPFGVASPNLTPSPNSVAPRAATNSQSAAYRDAYPPSSTTDGGDGTRMMGSHTPLLQEQQQPLPHAQAQPHVDEQLQQVHSTSELAPSQTVAAAVPGAADSNSPHNNHSQENGFISPCCINSESDQVSNLEEKDHRAPSRSTSGLLHDQGVILGTPTHSTPRRIMFPSEAQQRAQLLPPSSRTNNSSAERDPQASTQSPAADLVRSPDGMRSEVAPHRRTPEMAEMAAHHSALPQPSNDYLSPQDQDEEEMVALPRSMARRGSVAAAEEPLSSPNAEEHNDDGSAAVSRSRRAARPQTNPSGSFSDPQHSQPSHTFQPPRAPAGPSSPALQIIGSYPSLAQPRRVPFSSEVRHQAQHTSPREYEEEEVAPTSPPTVVSRSRRPVVPITDLPEKEAEEEERPPTQRSILMRPTRIVEDGETPQDGYLSHRSRPGPLSPSQIAQLQDDGRSAMNARRPRSVVTVFSNEGSSTPPAHINQLSVHPQNLEVESSIPYAIHRPSERAPPQQR